MKAVNIKQFGGAEQLIITDYPTPTPKAEEILVAIAATALNRADLLQRAGKYAPPKGASPILGLEFSGKVAAVGENVTKWNIGDEVCGLLAGGGYAQYVTIHQNLALPVPKGLSLVQAAAIPEVWLTAYQALVWLADLKKSETILIHAGASGVGTAAIQLAKAIGATVIVTASKGKHALCKKLGADHTIDYKAIDFQAVVQKLTNGQGVNVIIDFIAGDYFQRNLNSLAMEGRLVQLAFMGGFKVGEVNILNLLRKRLHLMGSTLRARDLDYKIRLSQDLKQFAWTGFENGSFAPVIDSIFDWTEVAAAHRYMEANKNQGKVVLRVGS